MAAGEAARRPPGDVMSTEKLTMAAYALKHPHPDGGEWIQEHDSLEDALRYQSHNGGVLVMRSRLPGQPGLWWVEVVDPTPA